MFSPNRTNVQKSPQIQTKKQSALGLISKEPQCYLELQLKMSLGVSLPQRSMKIRQEFEPGYTCFHKCGISLNQCGYVCMLMLRLLVILMQLLWPKPSSVMSNYTLGNIFRKDFFCQISFKSIHALCVREGTFRYSHSLQLNQSMAYIKSISVKKKS